MSYVNRQHIRSFSKMQTCHMLTAQPSTYDMFALIELYTLKKIYFQTEENVNDVQIISSWKNKIHAQV